MQLVVFEHVKAMLPEGKHFRLHPPPSKAAILTPGSEPRVHYPGARFPTPSADDDFRIGRCLAIIESDGSVGQRQLRSMALQSRAEARVTSQRNAPLARLWRAMLLERVGAFDYVMPV
jgi:hypothetical protein